MIMNCVYSLVKLYKRETTLALKSNINDHKGMVVLNKVEMPRMSYVNYLLRVNIYTSWDLRSYY